MDSKLPSYEDSIAESSGGGGIYNLSQQATTARSQHIQTVISSYIMPILSDRASRGLSRTNIALLPQSGDVKWSELDINGDEQYEPVQLKSHIDTTEFWSQLAVLGALKDELTSQIFESDLVPDAAPLPSRPDPQRKQSRKTKLARALYMTYDDGPGATASGGGGGGGGSTRVKVEKEDFWQRVQTDLGLWDTVAKEIVVVKVDLE